MKKEFEKLKNISAHYRENVDEMSERYELGGRQDYLYSDAVKDAKRKDRNDLYNELLAQQVELTQKAAAEEIAKIRAGLSSYIVDSTDPATVQTLQALIAAGVELTDMEINAFAQKGGYGVLKLLEKPSKGHITAPSPKKLEQEIKDVERYFDEIRFYRGDELANIGTETYYGQSPRVANTILKGMIDGFGEKMDKLAERFAIMER